MSKYSQLILAYICLGGIANAWAGTIDPSCEERALPQFFEVRGSRNGFYEIYPNRDMQWFGDDGSRRYYRYIDGDASHLAILRRQLGEARFNRVMQSRNPAAAAQAELAIEMAKIRNALGPELLALKTRIRADIEAVPLHQELPESLLQMALTWLEAIGAYNPDGHIGHLQRNLAFLRSNHASGEKFNVIDIPVITGNVEAWRRGDTGQVRSVRLHSFRSPITNQGRLTALSLPYHMNLVEFAQDVFGEDRVIWNRSIFPHAQAANQYSHYFNGPPHNAVERRVDYTPLYLTFHFRGGLLDFRIIERTGRTVSHEVSGSLDREGNYQSVDRANAPPDIARIAAEARLRLRSGAGRVLEELE